MPFKPQFATLLAALLAAGCGGTTDTARTETVTVTVPEHSQTSTAHTPTVTVSAPQQSPASTAHTPTVTDLDPTMYQPLSARDFAILVTKDPDSARGHKIIIYGSVTQADAAMGPDAFRAIVMGKPHAEEAYKTNAVITANDPSIIANIVAGDQVTMYVEVVGSFTYDTQIGGKTTVPLFRVNIINVTAHV
ncbi:hypothetical protein [Mycolicibacterium psychrotolerans]|uniref:Lipoprotein n=1 Tax=Mycolicibacterium psychrotolerans TaxID=216929 RepID=A0A7I7MDX9_9MYCO|nr:hypothetical protein [Mycolicibacterium psychrotolerans]BBX69723.1 hypothetical protein MPSYJ_31840 [Mycolicibacterium psychrotolerans]